ncbi:hypothetical protein B0T17DRAFT_543572 [Bombardia bombarda]|uniref:Uncharacterized protein n=1 Tax=Bombardia bombarda TaxID=252184 RepID=A0AA39W4T2_9PEZI|nr:hypothetical protein B0T17DRAFT_543572 [Bombardia bombarda]
MLVGPMAIAGGTLEWLVDGASSANEISYRGPNTAIARVCNMLAFRKTCSTMKICSDNPKEKYASSVFFAELAGMKTTELNDKVYSVLGFMCKDWRPNYKPDYSKPFEVVSQEVMECVTSCDHDAGFLWKFDRLVDDPAACRDPSSVPSWVPNLRRKTPNLMEYYACGEEKPLKTSVIEGPQMRIPGWIISPVDRVVGPLTADQKILNDEFGRLINDAKSRAPHIEMLLEVHQRFAQCMRREWSKTTPESRSARFNGIMSDFFCADDVGSPTAERIWEIWEVVVKALQIRSPKWFEELIQDFLQGFSFYFARMEGRCYFETKSGYCGLGPSDTKREDVVAVFELCECPILLRKIKSKKAKQQNYTVVGPAYLDHAMDGEYANPEKREIIRLR